MTRATLMAANRAEVSKQAVHRVTFIELKFPSGTVRSNTGDRSYVWGGFTWLADARFLDQSGLSEVSDNRARECTVRLSGADTALVQKVMSDALTFSEANIYEGFCDQSWALVADPHPVAKNLLMSSPRITVESGATIIDLSLEKWTIRSRRPSPALGTPQVQRLRYANDTGFDRVAHIMSQPLEWGGEYGRAVGIDPPREYRPND